MHVYVVRPDIQLLRAVRVSSGPILLDSGTHTENEQPHNSIDKPRW